MDTKPTLPQNRTWLASDGVLLAATLALVLLCCFTAERWRANGGFGDGDGRVYGYLALDFYEHAVGDRLTPYTMQRVVPSLVVHHTYRALGFKPTHRKVVLGFIALGVIFTLATALAWCRIVDALQISATGRWLGWAALMLNYATLKWQHFSPVLTDMAGLALGAWLLVAYLRKNTLGLVALSLVGAFTWPTCMILGVVLLVFPRDRDDSTPVGDPWRYGISATLAAVVATLIYQVNRAPIIGEETFLDQTFEAGDDFLNLSIALAAGYVFLGVFALLSCGRLLRFEYLASARWWGRAALAVGMLVAVSLTQAALTRHDEVVPTLPILLRQTAYVSVTYPAFFLVTHAAFYGMAFVLILYFWPRACEEMGRCGRALPIVMGMALVLSLNPQSRFCINFFPIALAFAVKAADSFVWDRRQLTAFALASLFLSKVWYRIDHGQLLVKVGDLLALGPWLTWPSYAIQGAIELVIAVGFFVAWVHLPPTGSAVNLARSEEVRQPTRLAG